jgi:hypothetical protein
MLREVKLNVLPLSAHVYQRAGAQVIVLLKWQLSAWL